MGRKRVEQWYVTRKPSSDFQLYDFARSATQAKDMLRDLAEGSPIAHKSKSEGGLYNIYVKKGSVLWREKGGSAGGKPKMTYKLFEGTEPKDGSPIYQVIGVDNEYVGEWHVEKSDAQKELDGLKDGSTYQGGGEIKVRTGNAHREDIDELIEYLDDNSWSYKREKDIDSNMPLVLIDTKNVSREEVEDLNDYLENKSWNVLTYQGGGEIVEDSDGNKYELVEDFSDFKLGELGYNPLSGVVMPTDEEDIEMANENWKKVKKVSTYQGGGELDNKVGEFDVKTANTISNYLKNRDIRNRVDGQSQVWVSENDIDIVKSDLTKDGYLPYKYSPTYQGGGEVLIKFSGVSPNDREYSIRRFTSSNDGKPYYRLYDDTEDKNLANSTNLKEVQEEAAKYRYANQITEDDLKHDLNTRGIAYEGEDEFISVANSEGWYHYVGDTWVDEYVSWGEYSKGGSTYADGGTVTSNWFSGELSFLNW